MNLGTVLFVIIVILAIIGYVILVGNRFTQPDSKITKEPEHIIESITPKPVLPGEHAVLKISVDKALKWHLELDGVPLDDPARVTTEQHQRLINAIAQIRPWLDGKSTPPETAQHGIRTSLPATVNPTSTAEPALKIDALRGFRSLLNNEIKTHGDQLKGASIVEMIDEVLQAKLLGTALMERSIRLEESPAGGVIVCVGTQKYPGIDAVPEPEIRDIIKASIAAWEKK